MNKGPVFEAGEGWGGKISSWLKSNALYVIPGVAILILILVLALGGSGDNSTATTSPTPSASSTPTLGDAEEIIHKGDSYTTVARRIAKMSDVSSLIQTPGAHLYTETILAKEIQNQPLIVGATIKYNISHVNEIRNGYQKLYPSQRAKWEAMARNIKF